MSGRGASTASRTRFHAATRSHVTNRYPFPRLLGFRVFVSESRQKNSNRFKRVGKQLKSTIPRKQFDETSIGTNFCLNEYMMVQRYLFFPREAKGVGEPEMTSLAHIRASAWSAPVSAQNTPREIDGVRGGKVIGKHTKPVIGGRVLLTQKVSMHRVLPPPPPSVRAIVRARARLKPARGRVRGMHSPASRRANSTCCTSEKTSPRGGPASSLSYTRIMCG
jgi:hypothetical protein